MLRAKRAGPGTVGDRAPARRGQRADNQGQQSDERVISGWINGCNVGNQPTMQIPTHLIEQELAKQGRSAEAQKLLSERPAKIDHEQHAQQLHLLLRSSRGAIDLPFRFRSSLPRQIAGGFVDSALAIV